MTTLLNFIPVSYTIHSRIKSKSHFLSWIYLFPLFGVFAHLIYGEANNLYIYFILFFAVISVYEVGYLYNDIYTVKSEEKPTERVKNKWFLENFKLLVFSRICFIFISLLIIWLFVSRDEFKYFFIFIVLLGFSFCIHNLVRSKWNVLTFLFLVFMKYTCLLVFLHDYTLVFMTFISITLLRTIEYSAVKNYIPSFHFILKDLDKARVGYYLYIISFSFVLVFFDLIYVEYIFVPLYFFIYRVFVLLVVNNLSESFFEGREYK